MLGDDRGDTAPADQSHRCGLAARNRQGSAPAAPPTRMTGARPSTTHASRDQKLSFSGSLQQSAQGTWHAYGHATVRLWLQLSGSKTWHLMSAITTDARGQYSLSAKDTKSGTWYVAYQSPDTHRLNSTSVHTWFGVKQSTRPVCLTLPARERPAGDLASGRLVAGSAMMCFVSRALCSLFVLDTGDVNGGASADMVADSSRSEECGRTCRRRGLGLAGRPVPCDDTVPTSQARAARPRMPAHHQRRPGRRGIGGTRR